MTTDNRDSKAAYRVALRFLIARVGGPQVSINGRKYVLSDVWSMMGEVIEGLGAGKPGGAKLIEPEVEDASGILRKFRYLWVYNQDKPLVAMYRYSDGDLKCYGKPEHYMRDLRKTQEKGQLNRVSDNEFRGIERWSRQKQDETLRALQESIEANKSEMERKVGQMVQDWFDRTFLPRIEKGWSELARGKTPAGFVLNERLLPEFTEEKQMRSFVSQEVLKDFNEKAIREHIEGEFGGLDMDEVLGDSQWAYWLQHEVTDRFYEHHH